MRPRPHDAPAPESTINAALVAIRGLGLSDGEKLVYVQLFGMAGNRPGTVRTSRAALADVLERSERRVGDKIAALADAGLVVVVDDTRGGMVLYIEPLSPLESRACVRKADPQKQFSEISSVEEQCGSEKAPLAGVPRQPSSMVRVSAQTTDRPAVAGPSIVALPVDDDTENVSELASGLTPILTGTPFAFEVLSLKNLIPDLRLLSDNQGLIQEGEERFVKKLLALLPSLKLQPARKVARALDAGTIDWNTIQACIDWAREHSKADDPAELSGKAVCAFKRAFQDRCLAWSQPRADGGAA